MHTFFISCENVDGIMGLESIYLLRLFEMLHFSFWISDIEFDENLRTSAEEGFKCNFLESELSDWFAKSSMKSNKSLKSSISSNSSLDDTLP